MKAILLLVLGAAAWSVEYKDLVGTYTADYAETLKLHQARVADDKDGKEAEIVKDLERAKDEFDQTIIRLNLTTIEWSRTVEGDERKLTLPITTVAADGAALVVTAGPIEGAPAGKETKTLRLTSQPPLLIMAVDGRDACIRKKD